MIKADYIIIDFDSTFISKESLDMLAESCLFKQKNHLDKIEKITEQAMSGEINFKDSLHQRIKLIKATKDDVSNVSKGLNEVVTKSFLRNKEFIKKSSQLDHRIPNKYDFRANLAPREQNGSPKRSKGSQKAAKREPKGIQKGTKGRPKFIKK